MRDSVFLERVEGDIDPTLWGIKDKNTAAGREWLSQVGLDDFDLRCPGCEKVLLRGWSVAGARRQFSAKLPLVARCDCGTYSAVPSTIVP